MLKKVLSVAAFAAAGVGVAALVDSEFRDSLIDGAMAIKDAFRFDSKKDSVDAEPDEEMSAPDTNEGDFGPSSPIEEAAKDNDNYPIDNTIFTAGNSDDINETVATEPHLMKPDAGANVDL